MPSQAGKILRHEAFTVDSAAPEALLITALGATIPPPTPAVGVSVDVTPAFDVVLVAGKLPPAPLQADSPEANRKLAAISKWRCFIL